MECLPLMVTGNLPSIFSIMSSSTALRLMQLAERFNLPGNLILTLIPHYRNLVVTLIDTVGAWPSFDAERDGQSEAIATNLTFMAGLKVPIVTILVGEGGSGGALGIGWLFMKHDSCHLRNGKSHWNDQWRLLWCHFP